ncbi:MAG: four helix bundle protein [Phycisphaerales bacterium]|nr:four helix bundle protein [Phycisphaerales bacterium]
MPRLKPDFLERIEHCCDRVVLVAKALDDKGVSRRLSDQLLAAGTSIGANAFEADEAMSRKDFVKCLCIAVKEAKETRFWIRLIGRQGWIGTARLRELESEIVAIKKIMGSMIGRTVRTKAKPVSI